MKTNLKSYKNIEWKNLFRTIALLEAILLLVITFSYGNKIDEQKELINKQKSKLEEAKTEILRLRLIEQEFYESKDYMYDCYQQVELNAERSGK